MSIKKVSQYRAEVSYVSGAVEKSSVKDTWSKLSDGDSVKQGDRVRVVGEGRAVIALDDGSAVRLSGDSKILMSSLDPKNIQIVNEKGEVYARVVKSDRPFVVKVGDESYKALGTAYKTVNLEKQKGVFVYESKVKAILENKEIAEGKKFFKENTDKNLVKKVIDISKDEIEKDTFAQWNKQQDLKDDEFKKYMGVFKETAKSLETKAPEKVAEVPKTETSTTTNASGITLYASPTSNGINFSWKSSGVDTSKGYKLVKGSSSNPTYPENSVAYINAGNTSYSMKLTNGATYYFRICQYTGNGCGVYSNNVKVTAPNVAPVGQAKVYWTVDEANKAIFMGSSYTTLVTTPETAWPSNGFKLVWSKSSSPVYPNRESDRYSYYPVPSTRYGVIEAFDGPGSYYVRVCEYIGSACGVYSNQITVNL